MMSTTAMRGYCGRLSQVWFLLGLLLMALPLSAKTFRIYVTNHAGDTVDVIDPATNKIVQVIEGVEVPHDVSFSPDGSRVYLSIESENVLDVVDTKSLERVKSIPDTCPLHDMSLTPYGKYVVAGSEETMQLPVVHVE